jgi:hypothetical protein
MQPWWQQPFFQVALPIMITFALTFWAHNRRIDDLKEALGKRLDAIKHRLERIEQLLTDHDRRITALEERTSPLRR